MDLSYVGRSSHVVYLVATYKFLHLGRSSHVVYLVATYKLFLFGLTKFRQD
jgi:hypothetical protein